MDGATRVTGVPMHLSTNDAEIALLEKVQLAGNFANVKFLN